MNGSLITYFGYLVVVGIVSSLATAFLILIGNRGFTLTRASRMQAKEKRRAEEEQFKEERERIKYLEAERDRLLPDLLRQKDLTNAERERAEHFEAELRKALDTRRGWFRRFFGF